MSVDVNLKILKMEFLIGNWSLMAKKLLINCMSVLTALQRSSLPARTLSASSTMRPAAMAFVVAIAGIMLPAMAVKKSEIASILQMEDIQF